MEMSHVLRFKIRNVYRESAKNKRVLKIIFAIECFDNCSIWAYHKFKKWWQFKNSPVAWIMSAKECAIEINQNFQLWNLFITKTWLPNHYHYVVAKFSHASLKNWNFSNTNAPRIRILNIRSFTISKFQRFHWKQRVLKSTVYIYIVVAAVKSTFLSNNFIWNIAACERQFWIQYKIFVFYMKWYKFIILSHNN